MLTLDPATLLPTGEFVEGGLPPSATARIAEIKVGGEDVNAFRALAREERHAATLSGATGGDLDHSVRHRELRGPAGFGDELRAALVEDTAARGGLTLMRGADRVPFTPQDAALVDSVGRHLAEGVRRALLLSALSGRGGDDDAAGLALPAQATRSAWPTTRPSGRPRAGAGGVGPLAARARVGAQGRSGGPRGGHPRAGAAARPRATCGGRLPADGTRAR